jgi:hypothetical protein
MTDTTPRSGLPLLAAAQAQKHVTHNEALLQLDALDCARILDRDLSAPPSSPGDGDTYLVKATGTGDWTGQDGRIAFAVDGAWRFYASYAGLIAYVADEAALIVFDGTNWVDFVSLLRFQSIALSAGSAAAPPLTFGDTTTGWYGPAAGSVGLSVSGLPVWTLSASGLIQSVAGGGLSQINVLGEGTTQQNFSRYSNDGNSAVLSFVHGRGTIASRGVAQLNDVLGTLQFSGYNGSSTTASSRVRGLLIETGTVGASAMGGQLRFEVCPIGSGSVSEVMRLDVANGLSLFGANPVIDQNRGHRLRSTTIAGAVSPSVAGNLFYHSDSQNGAGEVAVDTGSAYRHAGQAAVKKLTADADATYTPRADGRILRDSAMLTADRKLTLATTNVTDGHKVELSRRGSSGGFNRKIYQADGTTLIVSLADNTSADFIYDATAALWFQK